MRGEGWRLARSGATSSAAVAEATMPSEAETPGAGHAKSAPPAHAAGSARRKA